ncbi:MAG: histidinol dehydrogenase [Actinobacteria bacterium]|nr:histidinol dehydrogenase [Actinomycetota bacterium]MBU1944658.1 histidinol dehydrogenase [Actinomycetota bacterium]MBU2689206.1 histidinol dehydrogenase [Actinomycetota bacterium]
MAGFYEIETKEEIPRVVAQVRDAGRIPARVLVEVGEIIDNVRARGDEALLEYTRAFDGVELDPGSIEVDEEDREAAWGSLEEDAAGALDMAAGRIALFARESLGSGWQREVAPGVSIGQVRVPLESAGLYVPGGRFAYPSTVLMTGIPAREAGVRSILFCVPPGPDGEVNGVTLAATWLVGECRVFRIGGAQAVAAMAIGTESVPACGILAGPGNAYVTAAKRLLAEEVKIDLEAGPSEVAVYVDETTNVAYAAADVLAQLEHDSMACAVLVSESAEVLESASAVEAGMTDGLGSGAETAGLSLVRCASRGLSLEFLNVLAPEHLELMVGDAEDLVSEIRSAGCLFVGEYAAVALGDYVAGPSHVLPTGGSAARLSGLSAADFTRIMNVVRYTAEGFEQDAPAARVLAGLEGLSRHAMSLDIRMRG